MTAGATQDASGWQLAVFDLDGTLVDTRRDLLESLADTLHPRTLDAVALQRAEAALHMGTRAMLAAALDGHAVSAITLPSLASRFARTYAARIARHTRPYPGVVDTLQWLRARGVRLAICSNKSERLSRILLQTLDLAPWFPVIVGPESTGKAKPHPAPLHHAVRQSRVALSRTVMIGDSLVDLRCAEAAGTDAWIYAGGYDPAVPAAAARAFTHFHELHQPALWARAELHRIRSLP